MYVEKATENSLFMPTNMVVFVLEPRPRTKLSSVKLAVLEIFLGLKILMKSLKW